MTSLAAAGEAGGHKPSWRSKSCSVGDRPALQGDSQSTPEGELAVAAERLAVVGVASEASDSGSTFAVIATRGMAGSRGGIDGSGFSVNFVGEPSFEDKRLEGDGESRLGDGTSAADGTLMCSRGGALRHRSLGEGAAAISGLTSVLELNCGSGGRSKVIRNGDEGQLRLSTVGVGTSDSKGEDARGSSDK